MIDNNLFGMDMVDFVDVFEIVNDADRESSCDIEFECSASQILNPRRLTQYSQKRDNATGEFPKYHVLPSVVAMLENLGLSTASASQSRHSDDIISMNQLEKYKDIIKRIFKAESVCDRMILDIPKAYSLLNNLDDISPLPSQFDRISTILEQHSFAFSSQQIKRASIGLKLESSQFADPGEDNMCGHSGFEEALQEMLQQDSASDEECGHIPQLDGADDFPDWNNLWSDPSYVSDSTLGPPEFKSEVDVPFTYKHLSLPPKTYDLLSTLRQSKIPRIIHKQVFEGHDPGIKSVHGTPPVIITPAACPPLKFSEAVDWIKTSKWEERFIVRGIKPLSQIEGPTQYGSKAILSRIPNSSQLSDHDNVSILSVECFGDSRGTLLSDPEHDQILAVFWSFMSSISAEEIILSGVIMQSSSARSKLSSDMLLVKDEKQLFDELVKKVNDLDPDILCGYEIEDNSWGHLQDRSQKLNLHLARAISRSLNRRLIDPQKTENEDPYAAKRTSTFQVFGRICLNVWRIVSSELSLRSYSFENVAMQILHENYPKYRQHILRFMYYGDEHCIARPDIFVKYFALRAAANISLLIRTEMLNRTCEFARLFGVDFFSVVSRGSQYKVESLMIRLAHLENFLAFSPSKADVVRMAAPESLPLVMEPKSGFYVDPVVVLDFQALYPSIIIAYNYCFSTCLGRVNEKPFPKTFASNFVINSPDDFRIDEESLTANDQITISPNRVAFVTKDVREGILPKMLTELLEARILVKSELSAESNPVRRYS